MLHLVQLTAPLAIEFIFNVSQHANLRISPNTMLPAKQSPPPRANPVQRPRFTKRRLILLAIAILFAMLLGWFYFPHTGPGVYAANADRIKKGMTFEEVSAILGGLPQRDNIVQQGSVFRLCSWEGTGGRITAVFDDQGGVLNAGYVQYPIDWWISRIREKLGI